MLRVALILLLGWLARAHAEALPVPAADGSAPGSGVPLGGIGGGKVDLLPDGAFALATINNNQGAPIQNLPGCFLALWTKAGERVQARALSRSSAYGLPSSPSIEFEAAHPFAVLRFMDTALPVSVTVRAFSPLIPQDIRNSSLPAILFTVSVRNEANAPVEAALALSWENTLGVGGSIATGRVENRAGTTMESYADQRGRLGWLMGSGELPRDPPANRIAYNARGTYALLTEVPRSRTASTARWDALAPRPPWWAEFEASGTVASSHPASADALAHPAGVVAVRFALRARETAEIPFVFAWHIPRRYTLGAQEYGHYYERAFESARDVAVHALDNRLSLAALTEEWQQRLLRSSLPTWFARMLVTDCQALSRATLLTRDSSGAEGAPGPALFVTMPNPVQSADASSLEARLGAHALLSALFPAQEAQELRQIASAQAPDGSLPDPVANADRDLLPPPPEASKGPARLLPAAAFVVQVAHLLRRSDSTRLRNELYPPAKRALTWLAAQQQLPVLAADHALVLRAYREGEWLGRTLFEPRFAEQCAAWAAGLAAQPPHESPSPKPARGGLATLREQVLSLSPRDPEDQILEAAQRFHARSNESGWHADSSEPLRAAIAWHLLDAWLGLTVDLPAGSLSFEREPKAGATLSAPLFAAGLWGWIEQRATREALSLGVRLDRVFPLMGSSRQQSANGPLSVGSGLVLRSVRFRWTRPGTPSARASVGRAHVPCTVQPAEEGYYTVSFDANIRLSVGERLEIVIR